MSMTMQAGIVQNGGLDPLIDLVESHAESLQHNAAFALYGLADNPDNIAAIIKAGGAQRLQNAELIAQVHTTHPHTSMSCPDCMPMSSERMVKQPCIDCDGQMYF